MQATNTKINNPGASFANEAVDVINCGLFQVNDGRLSNANRMGMAMLKDGFLFVAKGQLMCTQPQYNRMLQSLCSAPPDARDVPLILRDPQSNSEYCVRTHKTKSTTVLSVIRLRKIDAPNLAEVRIFAGSYGLSEAEIHVLHAVLGSTELRILASQRGVNLDTVRKQLKSAMAKIEISSQKELFALYERFRLVDP